MKKLILFGFGIAILTILFSNLSSATFECYQEFNNGSNQCNSNGWNNSYITTGAGVFNTVYINYTKPYGALNSSLFQVKHGSLPAYNITIPNSCWQQNPLKIRGISSSSGTAGTPPESWFECNNETSWILIGANQSGGDNTSPGCVTWGQDPKGLYDGDWVSRAFWYHTLSWITCGSAGTPENSSIFEEGFFWIINRAIEGQTSYSSITYSGSQETFITNVSIPTGASFSNYLIWNNTQYSGTATNLGGNNYTLSSTIVIPENVTGNITWFWRMNFSVGEIENLTNHIQELEEVTIDDCSVATNLVLNFSLFDEDNQDSRLSNGTIEVLVNLYNSQRTSLSNVFSKSYTVNQTTTARVCIDNINLNDLSMDYQTRYYGNSTLYVPEYKFAQAITLTNSTAVQNIKLYDLLSSRSTTFTITLQNPDLSIIEGAVIDIQRQYLSINQFLSVESPKTNNLGETIAHLVHNQEYYNFVVTKNGVLLGTFNNNLVQCQNIITGDCRISLNLIDSIPSLTNYKTYGNITGSFTWTPSTRDLFFNFVSNDQLAHNVSWQVLKLDSWGNTTICSTEVTATTGTLQCTIPTIYGNSSIQTKIYSDGVLLGYNYFSLGASSSSIFGASKVVFATLMYSTITLMMIAHPVTMILGSILGMIFAVAFHIVDGGSFLGNASIVLWFIIAGGVIIFYMRNKT